MHATQSRFLQHEPCPKCNSKDNLARYDNGSAFCFGCAYYERASASGISRECLQPVGVDARSRESEGTALRSLPDDTVSYYPPVVVEWISRYDLAPLDLMVHNVVWSPKNEQLIYRFFGEGQDVVLWQARNFRQGTTHKRRFFTGGSPADVVAKYSTGEGRDTCCIVEDCISGIKLAYAGVDGVPCFSATMSKEKLARLCRLYKKVIVWLDSDKLNESRSMTAQACMLGAHTKSVFTEFDPKEYTIEEIREYIKFA